MVDLSCTNAASMMIRIHPCNFGIAKPAARKKSESLLHPFLNHKILASAKWSLPLHRCKNKKTGEPMNRPISGTEAVNRLKYNVPPLLQNTHQWVNWRLETRDGKATKPPVVCESNRHADKMNPEDFSEFEHALYTMTDTNFQVDGAGIVLVEGGGLVGLDIDDCFVDGEPINQETKALIEELGRDGWYLEISPSGNGLRGFMPGVINGDRRKSSKAGWRSFEMYDGKAYLTVTGNKISDNGDLRPNQDSIDRLHNRFFGEDSPAVVDQPTVQPINGTLSDSELIRIIENSKVAEDFKSLYYEGNTSKYNGDASAADMGLMNHLAFWTNKNAVQMESLFFASSLGQREKWINREDYRDRTIQAAIKNCPEGFTPKSTKKVPEVQSEEAIDWPDMHHNGTPKNTIENLKHLTDKLGAEIRNNLIFKDIEIVSPGQMYGALEGGKDAAIDEIVSQCCRHGLPKSETPRYLNAIAFKNPFNPIMEWIQSKPYDGQMDYISALCKTVTVRGNFPVELKDEMMKKWLISAVVMAGNDEAKYFSKGVLTMQGLQDIGKTSWFWSLLPDELQEYGKEGLLLKPDEKDSVMGAIRHWLVELGELEATFNKADIARIKAFLTNKKDNIRQPYNRKESVFPRRTAFFASVNPDVFLRDDTGNVRFWVIPVEKLDFNHGINMQQVWAQAYSLFLAGEKWYLDADNSAKLEQHNEDRREMHPIEEKLISWLYSAAWQGQMTATEILKELEYEKPSKVDLNVAGRVLRKYLGEPVRDSSGRRYDLANFMTNPEKTVTEKDSAAA
jgi:predicted P-loop ATPase